MRKTYLDNIKWITAVIVVIYHVIYMYNGVCVAGVLGPFREVQYQDAFQYIVYPWFMMLLFIVSGMSGRYYLSSHSHKEYRKMATVRYLVPSTLGVIVFGGALGYFNLMISGAFENFPDTMPGFVKAAIMIVSGTGPLWYLQMLWLFAIVLILVRKIEKDRLYLLCEKTPVLVVVALFFAIWGSAQILNTPVVVVYRFGVYGVCFFLGYYIFSHDLVMDALSKYWAIFSAVAVILGIAFVVNYWGQPYAEHSVLDTFLCNAYAWSAILAIFAVMNKWGNFENGFSKYMKKQAWGLYLFHYLPLAACAWYMSIYCTKLPPVVHYAATAVSAFAGAIILYEIIKRIPVLRWLICGIERK